MMQALNYSDWKDTAHLLHMTLQMMGKVKLKKMRAQPEWNQVLLNMTTQGFTTGPIPDGENCFEISFDVISGRVTARCTTGHEAGFQLRDKIAISEVYEDFGHMLRHIKHETNINPTPQECANLTLFHKQTAKLHYERDSACNYFECCALAYSAILNFAAPLRCKKILPSMFWGTFDMTAVLFSCEEEPFSGKGKIEQVAFDEKMAEFGFWPGDDKTDQPSFFVLAYPFIKSHPEHLGLRPRGAYFSAEKMEYFLPLAEVLKEPNPAATIEEFCTNSFTAILAQSNWKHKDWFTKSLL